MKQLLFTRSATIIQMFALILLLMTPGCLTRQNTYGVIGNPAISSDGKIMVVVVAESEATSYQVNGGYRRTSYATSYWLKQYETATGELLKKRKILSAGENENMLLLCYGGFAGKIWLHTFGFTAYDIYSLKETVNEAQLAAQNNFDRFQFPDEQRFIEESVSKGFINFTAQNGEAYHLDLGSLKITAQSALPESESGDVNNQSRWLERLNPSFGVRTDSFQSKMFMLAKDSITARNSYPGNGDDDAIYKKLYLFSANWRLSTSACHKTYVYTNLQQQPGKTYLNAVILKDCITQKTVHLQGPGAFIILHQDEPGGDAKTVVTAVTENNSTVWQVKTGCSTKLANCTVQNNYCILIGNRHAIVSPHTGSDYLCAVNTVNGALVTMSIKE